MKNTLKWAKDLEEAGFPQKQAEATVRLLTDIMEDNFATKNDLKDLSVEMNHRFELVDAKIDRLSAEVSHKIDKSNSEITIKMGAMLSAAVVLIATLVKFL